MRARCLCGSLSLALLAAVPLPGRAIGGPVADMHIHEEQGSGSAPSPGSAAAAPLTNTDVIRMVQAGLGESVVLAAIRTAAATNFDRSTDALIALKKGGVSDAIVAVMIDPQKTNATAAAPAVMAVQPGQAETRARVDSATASPAIPREAGIYWDRGSAGGHDLVALEPTVFSQARSGGVFMSALTYGIKKANWKAVIRGPAAGLRMSDRRPVFYFYFENRGSGLSNTGGFSGWLAGASSPNEFVLAKMTPKSRERELIVGEFGAYRASSGTRAEDTVDFQVDRLDGGVYRVTPARALVAGEYCFFYAAAPIAPGAATPGKLFDFSVRAARPNSAAAGAQ